MDRLTTKLQVKSFITKKIINEINRKIGLKYLTEGPERFVLDLFSRQKDDEETTEKQVPNFTNFINENPLKAVKPEAVNIIR